MRRRFTLTVFLHRLTSILRLYVELLYTTISLPWSGVTLLELEWIGMLYLMLIKSQKKIQKHKIHMHNLVLPKEDVCMRFK